MKKCLFIILFFLYAFLNTNAQKKLVYDIGVGVNKSIAKNRTTLHYTSSEIIQSFVRKKYKNPYINITGSVSCRLKKNFLIGFKSGIYIYILEEYSTDIQRTTVSIPLELSVKYKLFNVTKNSLGLEFSGGVNLFKIDDYIELYRGDEILNASLYYVINNRHLLKLGIEEQIDNVRFNVYYLRSSFSNEIFDYKLHRLSINLSYFIQL